MLQGTFVRFTLLMDREGPFRMEGVIAKVAEDRHVFLSRSNDKSYVVDMNKRHNAQVLFFV